MAGTGRPAVGVRRVDHRDLQVMPVNGAFSNRLPTDTR
jgi:hypothetical protein